MPGPSPSNPLGLLNPGEFFMNLGNTGGPNVGQNINFAQAVATYGFQNGQTGVVAGGSTASGLTASGTTLANGYAITAQSSYFTVVPSGAAAVLPAPPWPDQLAIGNFGVSGLSVFPPNVSGSLTGSGSAVSGVAYLQATGTTVLYSWFGGNQFGHSP